MFRKALAGLVATCACVLPHVAHAANANVVLYAADSSNLQGNWAKVADPTAAGGQTLTSADHGWSNTVAPAAAPGDYVEFTFNAPAATRYHVWMRMRATANSKYNDSIYAQFSDAVDGSGASLYAIGTSNGLAVNLAADAAATGLNGWGWQDGAYWLSQSTTIAFATASSHTLRIQTREDGVSIDQVVLSPVTYLSSAPGGLANDATIVPKAAAPVPSPWSNQDVGATGLAGSAAFSNGLFTVTGAGADVWGTADAFQFVSRTVAGDAQIVARVASLQNVNAFAKAGLMFRDTAAAGSANVLLDVRPNGSVEFMDRAAAGAATAFLAGGTQSAPVWLRLTRSGTTVTGETSTDGSGWTTVGTASIALAASGSVGLAVSSHDATQFDTATFDHVAVTLPPSAPSTPLPLDATAGVGLGASLTWSAAGATTYDVCFGTTNPPAAVASGLTNAAYTPSAMANGATYFWQVTAHNSAGTVAGPVWSFSAIVAPPAAPAIPAPSAGAIGVATSASLAWSAAGGATSYDVRFGSSNPPPAAASGLTSALFTPPALAKGSTYYWQVVARNAGGATAGPIWSFSAIVEAPAAATAPAPVTGVIGVAINTPLAWTAGSGATSHDVSLGTSNPPAQVASGIAVASFTPPTLAMDTTYYWQVTEHNAGGATAGPVWSFKTVAPATTAPGNIVLYAADATNLHGNWALVADITAAGGHALSSADRGFANTTAASAAPVDYFDVTFIASAGTPYHLWLRMRASADSKYNDSVYAQYSDAVDATGAAIYPIGTANALVVNLANDSTGSSLSGWGWQDGAYWLSQSATVKFATTGPHTLRVQTREDGAAIDQILLSATTYLTAAPGGISSDATIVAKPVTPTPPTGLVLSAPAIYNAISDRNAYPKPPLPAIGAAGFAFADPTFGSKMLRVTDGQTRPGLVNRSFRVPSNAHLAAWNAASTAFFVVSNDGTVIPYAFNPTAMTAARIQPTGSADGGLTLGFYVEPQFSVANPNLIFGVANGGNNLTIAQYDFAAGSYSTVVDLSTVVGGLTGTYVGGLMSGGTPAENLMAFFGGGSQDHHFYALWAPLGNLAARKLLNTLTSTINGHAIGTALNFHLHSAQIDKSGRFVFLYPTAVDLAAPRYAAQVYIWDTTTDAVTAITSGGMDGAAAMRPGGHDASGYGTWVNQDCCTSSSWDAAQWQFRELTSVSQTSDLISPVQATKEIYLADHTTWNNAQPGGLVPVISSTYRYGNNTAPWRAWDDEIIAIDTANGGGGIVWRFAHHRSSVASESDPTTPYFWYEPIANVSPDGKWVIFTSNWEKTLGTDSSEGTFRQDVFLVQLTPQP